MGGRIFWWGRYQGGNFLRGCSVLKEVSFSGKILNWENLAEFLYEILCISLAFLFRLNFTRGDVMGSPG